MAKRADIARDRLARLLRAARPCHRAVVAAQDRPDPDLRQGNAGQLMAALVDGLGQGGGHDMMAGGQVPLPEMGGDAFETLVREIELRFLRLADVSRRTPQPLVPVDQPADMPQAPGAGEPGEPR